VAVLGVVEVYGPNLTGIVSIGDGSPRLGWAWASCELAKATPLIDFMQA